MRFYSASEMLKALKNGREFYSPKNQVYVCYGLANLMELDLFIGVTQATFDKMNAFCDAWFNHWDSLEYTAEFDYIADEPLTDGDAMDDEIKALRQRDIDACERYFRIDDWIEVTKPKDIVQTFKDGKDMLKYLLYQKSDKYGNPLETNYGLWNAETKDYVFKCNKANSICVVKDVSEEEWAGKEHPVYNKIPDFKIYDDPDFIFDNCKYLNGMWLDIEEIKENVHLARDVIRICNINYCEDNYAVGEWRRVEKSDYWFWEMGIREHGSWDEIGYKVRRTQTW